MLLLTDKLKVVSVSSKIKEMILLKLSLMVENMSAVCSKLSEFKRDTLLTKATLSRLTVENALISMEEKLRKERMLSNIVSMMEETKFGLLSLLMQENQRRNSLSRTGKLRCQIFIQ